MIMISDVELVQLESVTEMMDNMDLLAPHPIPPEELVGNENQQIRYFHSKHFGFHNCYPARFTMLGHQFTTMEQYVSWQKARYFGDHEIAGRLLRIMSHTAVRQWGQRVRGFQLDEWREVRDKIMYEGLRAKFTQNALLFEQLRATGDALIAEASVANPYWTNGVSARNLRRLRDPAAWTGKNRMGEMLMELREELRHSIF